MTQKKLKLFLITCLLGLTSFMQAQTVSGTVSDATDGTLLPGVNVLIRGTSIGASTNFDGEYTIDVGTTENPIIQFSYMGYTTQEILVDGKSIINVSLVVNSQALDEVVVTALGIKKEQKALGYSVQEVGSDDLNNASNGNVVMAMQGKVAGVNISATGGAGGNSRIEMRGNSSLADNSEVLWVIDGVPFNTGDKTDGEIWGGVSNGGAMLDIDPENVQSMSVLKGGAAAALYGSRGANGVILITTKNGSNSQGLGITYTGSVTFSDVAYVLDLQNEYGQGVQGEYDPHGVSSWGPKFDGLERESWTGDLLPYVGEKNKLKNFSSTGLSYKNGVSFSNSYDKGNYRVSLANDNTKGLFEGHEINRINFDLRGTYDINSWLNIDSKVSYVNTKGQQRPEIGNYSYMSFFNSMPANIRLKDLSPGYDIIANEHVEKLYTTPNASYRNPYFLEAQRVNSDERNRTFGFLAANVRFADFLKLQVKYGLDYYRYETVSGFLYADTVDSTRPNYNTSENFFEETNASFLLSFNKELNDIFTLGASIGGNIMHRYSDTLSASSGRLIGEGDFFLSAAESASTIKATETFSESEIQSLYSFVDLSYNDLLFLSVTARNDWSSTLPKNNNSFFYPSVSLSGLISDMTTMPDWVSYLKVRASWAQVGKDTDPYSINQVYTLGQSNFNLTTSNEPDILVNENLKPEISTSTEFGFTTRLFESRLNFDFTYYIEDTKNQIVNIDLDQSTGYDTKVTNLGLVNNKGVEIIANVVALRTDDWELGVSVNFAKNTGVIKELTTAADDDEFFSFLNNDALDVEVRGTEGDKMGDILGTVYERNADGAIIVDNNGLPVTAAERELLGNLQPSFLGGFGLNASYKDFSFNALFAMQQGGDIYSKTEASAASSGTALRTAENDRASFVLEGVTADGAANTEIITAQEYWTSVAGIAEEFMYDASYMKLKEISISYNLSQELIDKVNFLQSARISIYGRDLWYVYKDTPGTVPDASSYSTSYGAKAVDFSPVPVTSSIGCSLNVNF